MAFSCETCNKSFGSELALDLHRDSCGGDQLFCRKCGERFAGDRATKDGWFYTCPNEECDGEGIGEDLVQVDKVRVMASH